MIKRDKLQIYLPPTTNINVIVKQWQDFLVIKFIFGLNDSYFIARNHLLVDDTVSDLGNVFNRLLSIKVPESLSIENSTTIIKATCLILGSKSS